MTETKVSGVRAKLQKNKEAKAGTFELELKECGVIATIPKFINHGVWSRAQRIAKGNVSKAQTAFIAEAVLFDGEKLTVTDLTELVPAMDVLTLTAKLFGDDDEDEGNGKEAA